MSQERDLAGLISDMEDDLHAVIELAEAVCTMGCSNLNPDARAVYRVGEALR